MRIVDARLLICALALFAVACGPHRHGGPHGGTQGGNGYHHMAKGCGPEGCAYRNRCFSDGAVSANAGVCQQCTQGHWVASSGCRDGGCGMGGKPCDHHDCHGSMDGKPCDHDHHGGKGDKPCDHHGHKGKHRRPAAPDQRT